MSGESVRQRARGFFDCGPCAGSGRVMTGAVQSDVCGKCGGSGTKSVTISEIVEFSQGESSLARKQEREANCKAMCGCCGDSELWMPAEKDEFGDWIHRAKRVNKLETKCDADVLHERGREAE